MNSKRRIFAQVASSGPVIPAASMDSGIAVLFKLRSSAWRRGVTTAIRIIPSNRCVRHSVHCSRCAEIPVIRQVAVTHGADEQPVANDVPLRAGRADREGCHRKNDINARRLGHPRKAEMHPERFGISFARTADEIRPTNRGRHR